MGLFVVSGTHLRSVWLNRDPWDSLEVNGTHWGSVGLIGLIIGQWGGGGGHYGVVELRWRTSRTQWRSVELIGVIMSQWGLIGCQWCSVESIGVCGACWGLGGISVQCKYTHGKFFIILYERVNTLMISQFYICIVRKSWPF